MHNLLNDWMQRIRYSWISAPFWNHLFQTSERFKYPKLSSKLAGLWSVILVGAILLGFSLTGIYFYQKFGFEEIGKVFYLGGITALRVIALIVLSSMVWIPVGVVIGLRPRLAQNMQPIIQFFAAFPANLFYPIFVVMIVKFHLNPEIWLTPLMILGTQWYILFNVIAGTTVIPSDFKLLAENFHVKGLLWWKRLMLPAIFPYFVTGAVTAAGGAWNASIVAECVSWGDLTLKATGLGEYIATQTISGDFPRLVLGTLVMCLYVLLFNHVFWRPMYRFAEERFGL